MEGQKERIERSDPPPLRGLTSTEAAQRLVADGPNALPSSRRRSVFAVALEVMGEPMLLLLLIAGVIYLVLGNKEEAALIVSLACATVVISIVQQARSERVIERLASLSDPMPMVERDGLRQRVPSASLVRGDLLALQEGDRVAADAVIVEGHSLEADESLLTGESLAVVKTASRRAPSPDLEDHSDQNRLFSGSLVVRGRGLAVVTATGLQSAIGQIGKSLNQIEREAPPLREQIRGTIFLFAAGGIALSVLAFLLSGIVRGAWLDGLLGGVALSMALLPEEFPVVLTLFLVMGAWRISRVNVLTRRASAIETLGSASVLCTDKTGTLTQNRMEIVELRTGGQTVRPIPASHADALAPPFQALLAAGCRASEPEPVDPMDIAFRETMSRLQARDRTGGLHLIRRYPLSEGFLAVVNVWRGDEGTIAACKGAPETVLAHCSLSQEERERIDGDIRDMAMQGVRVIAVATAGVTSADLPETPEDFAFSFLGLAGLQDPLRDGVREAVRECRTAGIRVIMITGDHPATARAIAFSAGLDGENGVITGDDLLRLDDEALAERVKDATVFARTRPEQKLRIVNALKANGEIVAMTGDGVNDAPALKAAHIGIAMGRRGTEVARAASSIVLLDDDFTSIVRTIKLGRRIYDNLRKAICFVMAAHVPIAGLALVPLLFGLPLILLPVHIAFLEIIIDPVSSLAFEAEPKEIGAMKRPPRDPGEPLLPLSLMVWSLFQGAIAFVAVAGVLAAAVAAHLPDTSMRALCFLTLVAASFTLILSARSLNQGLRKSLGTLNWTLVAVLGADTAIMLIIFLTDKGRDLFDLGKLNAGGFALAIGIAAGLLIIFEMARRPLLGLRPSAASALRAGD